MIEGRLRNFFSEKVLLEQPFVRTTSKRSARSPRSPE